MDLNNTINRETQDFLSLIECIKQLNGQSLSVEEQKKLAKQYCYAGVLFYREQARIANLVSIILTIPSAIALIVGIIANISNDSWHFISAPFIWTAVLVIIEIIGSAIMNFNYVHNYDRPYLQDALEFLESHGIPQEISQPYWSNMMARTQRSINFCKGFFSIDNSRHSTENTENTGGERNSTLSNLYGYPTYR